MCFYLAPGPPASLTFESPTAESLILYWTPPTETNGVLLGYTVQHQHGKSSVNLSITRGEDCSLIVLLFFAQVNTKRSHVLSFSNDVTDIKLDHLDPNSYYIFNVMAHTAAGDGPPITRRNATLLDGGENTFILLWLNCYICHVFIVFFNCLVSVFQFLHQISQCSLATRMST